MVVMPAQAGIQYAAAYRLNHYRLGILGPPPSQGTTAGQLRSPPHRNRDVADQIRIIETIRRHDGPGCDHVGMTQAGPNPDGCDTSGDGGLDAGAGILERE